MEDVPPNWPFPSLKGKPLNNGKQNESKIESAPLFDSMKSQRAEVAKVISEADESLF